MYQPVTVQATRRIADEFDKDVVVIVALDHAHDKTHFSSYGQAPQGRQPGGLPGEADGLLRRGVARQSS